MVNSIKVNVESAEVGLDALPSDEIFTSVQPANEGVTVSDVPLGAWFWYPGGAIPDNYMDISTDHGLLNRVDYPELWQTVCSACNSISEGDYLDQVETSGCCGYFSTGDCITTFRLPLIKGVYPRAADADKQEMRSGKYMGDAIRNITGNASFSRSHGLITHSSGSTSGVFKLGLGREYRVANQNVATQTGSDIAFDASLVVPIADENRPKTLCQIPIMKVRGGAIVEATLSIKAWGYINAQGVLLNSFNIASIERLVTGVYRATFINPAPHTSYVLVGSATGDATYNSWFQETRYDHYPRSAESVCFSALTWYGSEGYEAINAAMSFQVLW